MDDIPGDERAAGRRYECEGGERRQLERRWDERQHDDAGPSLPGPIHPGRSAVVRRMKWTRRTRRPTCVKK